MGIVYAAHDPQLDRRVALKLLHGAHESVGRRRLEDEARAVARLAHPNVVVVFEVGEVDGLVFMAMELVAGGTLRSWLLAETRDAATILDAFWQAGEGLAAAHDAGLVHRDFKPTNVLIDAGRPRVTDFGLAQDASSGTTLSDDGLAAASETTVVARTRTGALMGTPAYMSPEQFRGVATDARSDQFSFCIALVEGLVGERPFAGRTVAEVRAAVCAGEMQDAVLRSLAPRIRRAVLRGLSTDPAHRFPSIRDLLRALGPARRRFAPWGWGLVAVAAAGVTGAVTARSRSLDTDPVSARCGAAPGFETTWSEDRASALFASLAALDTPGAREVATHAVAQLDAYAQAWAGAR